MKTDLYPNRRYSYRFSLNIPGKIYLEKKNKNSEQEIHVVNISYNGLQVVFSDNEFLFDFFESLDDREILIKTSFEFQGRHYLFLHEIFWVRLYSIAERNFYILTTLKFRDKEKYENELLDLIYILDMQDAYIG
jgi:hypothetical protein